MTQLHKKQINKGRSPTLREESRTHRVDLDRLYDRINLDPMIQMQYVSTTEQKAFFLEDLLQQTDGHN